VRLCQLEKKFGSFGWVSVPLSTGGLSSLRGPDVGGVEAEEDFGVQLGKFSEAQLKRLEIVSRKNWGEKRKKDAVNTSWGFLGEGTQVLLCKPPQFEREKSKNEERKQRYEYWSTTASLRRHTLQKRHRRWVGAFKF